MVRKSVRGSIDHCQCGEGLTVVQSRTTRRVQLYQDLRRCHSLPLTLILIVVFQTIGSSDIYEAV